MNPRILDFSIAMAIMAALGIPFFLVTRRTPSSADAEDSDAQAWSLTHLLLASFLTLFAELALIRWIAVEVRVFAYFKNLALLLCFTGFGLGCALARRTTRLLSGIVALLGLIAIVRLPFGGKWLEGLSQSLGAAGDAEIWATGTSWHWTHFIAAAAVATVLFLLMVWSFVPLGQIVSRQMDRAPGTLAAYSWNLLASLGGILAFLGVSRLMLPPAFWLGLVLFGFALLLTGRERLLAAGLVVPLVFLLHDPSSHDSYSMWTPYQQIQYTRHYAPNGDFWGGEVWTNHAGYQYIVNLSDSFLSRHPGLVKEAVEDNPYNLPLRFAASSPSVMIVGSGTGNDVAAALRHNSRFVDAVEIDPAILALGKHEHPERPYDSPRVHVHLTDARAFLKRTQQRYDLILFGLLDSHTQFSDYSNMRIDNFVYTVESFREASRRLNPNGVLFVKFHVDHPWMAVRLEEMVRQTFGKPPLVFYADSSYGATATCFVISPANRVEDALAADPGLQGFVTRNRVQPRMANVPVTTDDWPYLYQEGRWIPRTYFSIGVIVILVALALYFQIPEARAQAPSLFFFSMGAGFLLLETQVISRLALFFGTTWQVNGIVISALLATLLLANMVTARVRRPLPRAWILAALLAGLAMAYGLPLNRIPGPPAWAGAVATAVFALPVFFAGLLFAGEFRKTESPSAALGANMLGAVAGGLLENLSFLFGMRALLLFAIALYSLAGIRLLFGKSAVHTDVLAKGAEFSKS
jgi:SAM-dependent methyltransferase